MKEATGAKNVEIVLYLGEQQMMRCEGYVYRELSRQVQYSSVQYNIWNRGTRGKAAIDLRYRAMPHRLDTEISGVLYDIVPPAKRHL